MNRFDPNQKDFLSFVHRSIWSNGLLLAPPEVSLKNSDDLYRFKSDMFADMYQNPAQYFIDVNGIEEAMGGKPWRKARLAAKWNKHKLKLSKLDEIEQTNLPHVICRQLLDYLVSDGNEYFMHKANYDKFFVTQSLKKCNYKIDEADLLSILSRCGLSVTHKEDRVYFNNATYPLLFASIAEWQKLLEPYRKGSKKYKYDSAFLHLDYRFFSEDHTLTFENSTWYMSDEVIAYLSDINKILAQRGKSFSKLDNTLRIAIGFRFKGSVNGSGHFEFEHAHTYPTINLKLFYSDSDECRAFEERINQLPNADEIRATCLKWVRRCNRCPCKPGYPASAFGNPKVIFGRKMKLCGPYLNMSITDFSKKSLAIVKTILQL